MLFCLSFLSLMKINFTTTTGEYEESSGSSNTKRKKKKNCEEKKRQTTNEIYDCHINLSLSVAQVTFIKIKWQSTARKTQQANTLRNDQFILTDKCNVNAFFLSLVLKRRCSFNLQNERIHDQTNQKNSQQQFYKVTFEGNWSTKPHTLSRISNAHILWLHLDKQKNICELISWYEVAVSCCFFYSRFLNNSLTCSIVK